MIKGKVINILGGPGCGKSTYAAQLYSEMSKAGYSVELVTEFAKDLTLDNAHTILSDQVLVIATQYHRLRRAATVYDYVITDSPLLTSYIYNKDETTKHLVRCLCFDLSLFFSNINLFIEQMPRYVSVGRNESEEEAEKIHSKILTYYANSAEFSSVTKSYDCIAPDPDDALNFLEVEKVLTPPVFLDIRSEQPASEPKQ